jgi:hypothetical protein
MGVLTDPGIKGAVGMKGLPEIEGWEYIGEFRRANCGEGFIDPHCDLIEWKASEPTGRCYPILHRKRWRAEKTCPYYYISSCLKVILTVDTDEIKDHYRYQAGNYFRTKEEAEQAKERVINALKETNR